MFCVSTLERGCVRRTAASHLARPSAQASGKRGAMRREEEQCNGRARTRLALAHANRQLQYVKGLAFGPILELLYALSSWTPERLCTVNHPKKQQQQQQKTKCFSLFIASRKNTASFLLKLMHRGTFHTFGRRQIRHAKCSLQFR